MKLSAGTSAWAQFLLSKQIGARFFFVVATNGLPPFNFYEYDMATGEYSHILPPLDYNILNKEEKVKIINWYWKDILKLIK